MIKFKARTDSFAISKVRQLASDKPLPDFFDLKLILL